MNLPMEKESLQQDQQWVESIVKKDQLNRFNLTNTDAPFNYFEFFPEKIITRIQTEKNKPSTSILKIIFLNPYAKIAVAATLILILGGTYLYNTPSTKKVVNEQISLQEIPNEEIINYVNNNEAIAEIDLDLVIKKENASLENLEEIEIQNIQKAIIQ
jgi:hypothetical protein